jgi:hypothetical protein
LRVAGSSPAERAGFPPFSCSLIRHQQTDRHKSPGFSGIQQELLAGTFRANPLEQETKWQEARSES